MVKCNFFPFLKLLFQLEVSPESLCIDLVQVRQKVFAQVFIILVQILQNQDAWNYQENVSVAAFHH
jgi:hypothetical protein